MFLQYETNPLNLSLGTKYNLQCGLNKLDVK